MTTHTPLDLRGKTMTQLIIDEADIGKKLDNWGSWNPLGDDAVFLLADRRQIRAEMLRRHAAYEAICKRAEEIPQYEIDAAQNVYP